MNTTTKTNKIILVAAVMTALTGSVFAAGVNNNVSHTAEAYGSEAFGNSNTITASASSSLATGYNNNLSAPNTFATGNSNVASGTNSIAGGEYSIAKGRNSVAIGSSAQALTDNTFAIGSQARTVGKNALALGNGTYATGEDTLAVGSTVKAADKMTTAIGHDATAKTEYSTVVGNQVTASGSHSLAIGSVATASDVGAVAIGSNVASTKTNSVAIGTDAIADVANGVAIGTNSVTDVAVGTTNIKDNTTDINFSNSTYAGSNPDSVVSFGTNGKESGSGVTQYTRQLQNVAAGRVSATSTDAINGSQLYDVALEAQKYNTLVDGTNTTVTSQDNAFGRKEYKVNINRDLTNMKSVQFNTVNDPQHNFVSKDGMHVFNSDVNTNYTSNGVKIEDTNNLDNAQYTLDGMVANYNGKYVEFTTTNITVGGQQIHGIAAGTAGTDAVNVNQLTSALNQVNGANAVLGNVVKANQQEARKGIAGTAALAGLHPLDFDPDHKLDIMAGYGHFHNANAGAVGIAYRPNEDLMFTAGTTFGSDNVINAGISYKVGARSEVSRSKVAMARDLADAKREIAQLQADNEKFKAILNAVLGLDLPQNDDVVFADVPQNHWAYAAVQDLANRGLVNGYEDGLFKGDRTLTRYEFAQVVYNAVQRAKETNQDIDQRLVEEFKPELMRFSLEGKVHERVHVNKSTKEVKRDQYGTIVK